MKLAAYAGVSVALAAGVTLKALHQRPNFYSACVYLSQSSANLMILTNLCLVAVGFLFYGLQRLLYGPLRPIETEQLYEKAWFAVTETCLAMTIFRGELGGWFLVMFVSLLVGKVWGWIGDVRVEVVEQQSPANAPLFYTRLGVSLMVSVLFDALMLYYCVTTVLEQARPDMMVMFGFEFAVLTILAISTLLRYSILLTEIYITRLQKKAKLEERRAELRVAREEAIRRHQQSSEVGLPADLPDERDVDEMELDVPGWEEKGRWVFYLDLFTDFFKLILYLSFFAILFTFYGLPIHILRDVVVTIRSFGRRVIDFIRYRNATRDMNDRYPDATPDEIAREDVCIICREEMVPWPRPAADNEDPSRVRSRTTPSDRLRPKKLPCGHILHFSCLRSWLERQQNCPTCRSPVVVPRNRPYGGNGAGEARGNAAPGLPGPDRPAVGNVPPADGHARARVFQFGPFRIGFGAGRGDLLQNLQQQLNQGNAPLPPPVGGAAALRAAQIGFGFGFGRPAAPTPQPPSPPSPMNAATVQNQLQQIEQQIAQEINTLRLTADQLHVVRLLQTELQRLRNLPAQSSNRVGAAPTILPPPPPSSLTSHRQFAFNPLTPAMGAGDSRLPEGLTLPQGWTLVPLHRVDLPPGMATMPGLSPTPSTTSTAPAALLTTPPPISTPSNPAFPVTANDAERTQLGLATMVEPLPSIATAPTAAAPSASEPEASNSRGSRPNTLSHDWTDVASDHPRDPTLPTPPDEADQSTTLAQSTDRLSSSPSPSSSKGKRRAATVEDLDEEYD